MDVIQRVIKIISDQLNLLDTYGEYIPHGHIILFFPYSYTHYFDLDKIMELYQVYGWSEEQIATELIEKIRHGFLDATINKRRN